MKMLRENPTKAQRKQLAKVMRLYKVIALGWCADLGLDPAGEYIIYDSAMDWSRVWLLPEGEFPGRDVLRGAPSLSTEEALDIGRRVLPLFLAAKALAGESVSQYELGSPEAWK